MVTSFMCLISRLFPILLLELSDGPNRDATLHKLFLKYKEWCYRESVLSPNQIKLLVSSVFKPCANSLLGKMSIVWNGTVVEARKEYHMMQGPNANSSPQNSCLICRALCQQQKHM